MRVKFKATEGHLVRFPEDNIYHRFIEEVEADKDSDLYRYCMRHVSKGSLEIVAQTAKESKFKATKFKKSEIAAEYQGIDDKT